MSMNAMLAGLVGSVLWCSVALAQPAPLLVDAAWLSQHLADKDLVVLHVGNKAGYAKEHIPGARQIIDDDVAAAHDHSNPKDLMLELPPVEVLRGRLAALGISDTSRIVVYVGANAGLPSATRIIFTLDYLGLGERTSLLNGGLIGWKRAGEAVTDAAPSILAGSLSPRPTKPLVVDAAFVKSVASRKDEKLVDARAAVFYKGIEPTYEKSGHIPGAVNIPFTDIADAQLVIDRDRVAQLFRNAGVGPTDTVVAYCHVGQQATAVLFAARLLGHRGVLYDGAFQDWAVYNRGPVEK